MEVSKLLEKKYSDVAGFHLSFDDIKEVCREAWKDREIYYLCFGRHKTKKNCNCEESDKSNIEKRTNFKSLNMMI